MRLTPSHLAAAGARLVVRRTAEMRRLEGWMQGERRQTRAWSVQGIGGVGKTMFLSQIEEQAKRHRLRTARIDGHLGFASAAEMFQRIIGQISGGAAPDPDTAQLPQILRGHLCAHRAVLLFDHFEEMGPIEIFIRSELLPQLPSDGVMLVFATRAGLPLAWRTDPALVGRLETLALDNFTPEQSLSYIARAGVQHPGLGRRIAAETAGYPLALAVAVESVLEGSGRFAEGTSSVMDISATLLREASPALNDLLEGLAFLRTATQDILSEVLEESVAAERFRSLGSLSFVRWTPTGLVMHDVARAHLLHDLKVRHPRRFDHLFRRTVHVLGVKLERAQGNESYDLTHNLVTLCTHATTALLYPDDSVSLCLSPRGLPPCEPMLQPDVDRLHALLDRGIAAGAGMPRGRELHELLDVLVRHFPDGVLVVRRTDGVPIAFATFVPLCKDVFRTLPAVADLLQDRLGEAEMAAYGTVSSGETDTTLSLLSCVAAEDEEYTFLDLLMALKVRGWTDLAQGTRCLLCTAQPDVARYYRQLGYEYLPPDAVAGSVDVFALDFRTRTMSQWLARLLLGASAWNANAEEAEVAAEEIHDALKNLRSASRLDESALAVRLGVTGVTLQRMLTSALSTSPAPKPLTSEGQYLLRAVYLQSGRTAVSIAKELSIGWTTYYRRREEAIACLADLLRDRTRR